MKYKMENYLDEELIAYSQSDIYPFHMPGHKRQHLGDWTPEQIDITEIDGFDNLHHAESILRDGQWRLAKLFGADESFYLVNGSTCGLLAAICGVTKRGDRILMARNCHKAVYHAAYLMELRAEYLYPEPTAFGIQGSINPTRIWEKLEALSDVAALIITSPTYDGIVSDIAEIAKAAHAHGIPLIVDEAHGAHFGFSDGFPRKAIALGADLCIESLHKTLPSFTQTAVLHAMRTVGGAYRFDIDAVKRYLGIFQTSSPSYVFMAGMDRCVRMLEQDRRLYRQTKMCGVEMCGGAERNGNLDEPAARTEKSRQPVKPATRTEKSRQPVEPAAHTEKSQPVEQKEMGVDSLFWKFEQRLHRFYEACTDLKRVQVFPAWKELADKNLKEGMFEKQESVDAVCVDAYQSENFLKSNEAEQAEQQGDVFSITDTRENAGSGNDSCCREMEGIWAKDNSKILISAELLGWSGQKLYDVLLERYHLQMEMASGHYVTALTSVMDTDEGFARLYAALCEIDESAGNANAGAVSDKAEDSDMEMANGGARPEPGMGLNAGTRLALYRPQKKRMELAEAINAKKEPYRLEDAAGRVSGEFIYLYPPGIPIIAPGELLSREAIETIVSCKKLGLQVQGLQDLSGETVCCVTENV